MKKDNLYSSLLLCLTVFLCWHFRLFELDNFTTGREQTHEKASGDERRGKKAEPQEGTAEDPSVGIGKGGGGRPDLLSRSEIGKLLKGKNKLLHYFNIWGSLEMASNSEIEFFGQVIDMDGNPIAGADVELLVSENGIDPEKKKQNGLVERNYHLVTDTNGWFRLKNEYGTMVSIESISKDGFYRQYLSLANNLRAFSYSNYRIEDKVHLKESDPPQFVLWKLSGHQDTVKYGGSIMIEMLSDGRPYYVDLLKKRGMETLPPDGIYDFKISVSAEQIAEQLPFDWEYQLNVPDGGLVVAEGLFPFLAPVDGYQSNYGVVYQVGDPDQKWTPAPEHRFYLKSRSGSIIAHLFLKFDIWRNGISYVNFYYIANLDGGRNLEANLDNLYSYQGYTRPISEK